MWTEAVHLTDFAIEVILEEQSVMELSQRTFGVASLCLSVGLGPQGFRFAGSPKASANYAP